MNTQVVRSVLRRPISLKGLAWRSVSSLNGYASAVTRADKLGVHQSSLLSSPPYPTFVVSGVRSFSSSDDDEELASQILLDLVTRELAEEDEAGSAVMPADLVGLKSQLEENWRIVDDTMGSGGATTRLFKKDPIGGGKVTVVFHCQDTVEEEEEIDDEEEPAVAVRFTVLITKAGKTMVLTCISEDAEARVEGVALTDDEIETVISSGIGSEDYQGPEFTELAEDLQETFSAYVQTECGVDSDMAAFISMYSDYKEQTQYVQWLKDVQGMLSWT